MDPIKYFSLSRTHESTYTHVKRKSLHTWGVSTSTFKEKEPTHVEGGGRQGINLWSPAQEAGCHPPATPHSHAFII